MVSKIPRWELPNGPVDWTLPFHLRGYRFNFWLGN